MLQFVARSAHPFYSYNAISRKKFLKRFPAEQIIHRLSNIPERRETPEKVVIVAPTPKFKTTRITFEQVFPEIKQIGVEEAKRLVAKLGISERLIQDALRTALRERGATNMTERKSDTSLEVADLEDFSLQIRWMDVAHQITKAYQGTKPDYVLVILAKDPVDGLITKLINYGKSVGSRHLVILVDPVNLARFLHAREVI